MEKKNNGILIGIIIILVVALLGAVIYIAYDKGIIFNNDTDIKVNEGNDEDVETVITDETKKQKLNTLLKIFEPDSLDIRPNIYKTTFLTDSDKLAYVLYELDDSSDVNVSSFDAQAVADKYKELYNEELKQHKSVNRCPGYSYNSSNNKYEIVSGCGGISNILYLFYTNKYSETSQEAYVYVSAGHAKGLGDTQKQVYINRNVYETDIYIKDNESNVFANRDNIINETNYNEFSEYKFTFGKREDGSFYYKNIERIK